MLGCAASTNIATQPINASVRYEAAFRICSHGSLRASTTLSASHSHEPSADTPARYTAQRRAETNESAWRIPRTPAWNAAIERNADEKSIVVSQWPRRRVASRPITSVRSALAMTRLIWTGEEVRVMRQVEGSGSKSGESGGRTTHQLPVGRPPRP